MKIVNLLDYDIYIDKVANWIYKEFVEGTKDNIDVDYIISILEKHKKNDIPITLIALEKNECLGTVTLFENDLKTMNLTPWLGSLYVDKDYRGRGTAKSLIDEAIDITRKLGYDTLYLRTEHTSEYYRTLGWEYIVETHDEIGIETEVFKRKL